MKQKSKPLNIAVLALFWLNSTLVVAQEVKPLLYKDVLDMRVKIDDPKNAELNYFSDRGAWHAYALPPDKTELGGFTGPLLMDEEGEWLSQNFCRLEIVEDGKVLQADTTKSFSVFYPGRLEQSIVYPHFNVHLQLIFTGNRTALIHTQIKNGAASDRKIVLRWKGKSLLEKARLSNEGSDLLVSFAGNEHVLRTKFEAKSTFRIHADAAAYQVESDVINLTKKQIFDVNIWQEYTLTKAEQAGLTNNKVSSSKQIADNRMRWEKYLSDCFRQGLYKNEQDKRLAVKCIVTLISNWRSAARDLKHDGVFPSVAFHGFWAWDSWKHAAALAAFHPQLALSSIQSMLDYTDSTGMVADCIYTNKSNNNWRDTKPPLAAWAAYTLYTCTHDTNVVKQLYPALYTYHYWWYRYRDHDHNGICEYGSTDGTLIAAKWESGMDNAIRFDSCIVVQNSAQAWSFNQESVDLNSYLYAEKKYLSALARIAGRNGEAKQLEKEASDLKTNINTFFYDNVRDYYFDRRMPGGRLITEYGPEGWIPLWAGIAAKKQTEGVAKIMMDSSFFNPYLPLGTCAANHPKINPLKGYWRGPVWVDQVYFGLQGLKQNQHQTAATQLQNKFLKHAAGLMANAPLRENYHPFTGAGLNANNFSWTAAHILLMFTTQTTVQ